MKRTIFVAISGLVALLGLATFPTRAYAAGKARAADFQTTLAGRLAEVPMNQGGFVPALSEPAPVLLLASGLVLGTLFLRCKHPG